MSGMSGAALAVCGLLVLFLVILRAGGRRAYVLVPAWLVIATVVALVVLVHAGVRR